MPSLTKINLHQNDGEVERFLPDKLKSFSAVADSSWMVGNNWTWNSSSKSSKNRAEANAAASYSSIIVR